METKRILSFFLAILIAFTMIPFTAMATKGDQNDPFTDITDRINFPVYPDNGAVNTGKEAYWVDGNTYAKVTLNIDAVPKATGVDVVLVLDNSASMGDGGSHQYSSCLNAKHYETFTFTKEVVYYVFNGGKPTKVTDEITVNAKVHYRDGKTNPDIVSYTVSGLETTYNGVPIEKYYTKGAESDSNMFRLSDLKDNGNEIIKAWLCSTTSFGGMTATKNGLSLTFPKSTEIGKLAVYHLDSLYDASYGCTFRMDVLKEASAAFADTFFAKFSYMDEYGELQEVDSDNKLSIVTFSDNAAKVNGGKFYTSSDADQAAVKQAFNNMTPDGNTSYVNPLTAAKEILDSREDKSRTAYVIFMSDGEPFNTDSSKTDTKAQIVDVVKSLSDRADGIYSVGVNLEAPNALDIIGTVVKSPGVNINVMDTDDNLKDVFVSIAEQTAAAGSGAVITDVIGKAFELVPDTPAQYPWTVTIGKDNIVVPSTSVSSKTEIIGGESVTTLTWNLNNIPSHATLSYYVKVKSGTKEGQFLATNEEATITYRNYLNKWCKKAFPKPELPYPGGSIRVVYYAVNDKNQPVSASGAPISDDRSSILTSGIILHDEYIQDNGEKILELLKPYTRTEDNYTDHGIYFKNTIMRKVDVSNHYTAIPGKTWDVTLLTLQDSYTILVGYSPDLTVKVTNKYGAEAPIITTNLKNAGEQVAVAPTDKAGYVLDTVNVTVNGITGGTITDHRLVTDPVTKEVKGEMPYGAVNIEYVYKPRTDIKYTVKYYKDSVSTANWLDQDIVESGTLGDTIVSDREWKVPAGYQFPGDIAPGSATMITAVEDDNIVRIVYKRKTDIKYTVKYYKDSVSTANWLDQDIIENGTLGDTIVPDREWKVPAGYQFPGDIAPGSATVITPVEDDNIVRIVYKRKTDIKYTVKYYKDSVSTANWLDQDIVGSGTLGDAIVPNREWKVPAGYQFPGDIAPGGATVITAVEDDNIVRIVYKRKTDIKYTVKYYKDSVSTANWLDQDIAGSGTLGDTIVPDREWKVPAGYQFPGDIAPGSVTVITAVEDDNIVRIVYKRKENIKYVVNYYKDYVGGTPVAQEPGEGPLGATIPVNRYLHEQPGYAIPGRIAPGSADVITAVEADNVVNVVFQKRDDIYYIVYYYKDTTATTPIGSKDGRGTLGQTIPVDTTLYAPPGYDVYGTIDPSSATVITAVEGNNIVKVVYNNRIKIKYNVYYYKDGIHPDNLLAPAEEREGYFGELIDVDDTLHAPPGYKVPGRWEGPVTLRMKNNDVYIIYDTKLSYAYKIEYYYDTLDLVNRKYTVPGYGYVGEDIFVDNTKYAPPGYTVPGEIVAGSATKISVVQDNNVVKVLYHKAKIAYTVYYYKDTLANYIDKYEGTELLGATIDVDRTMHAPPGYKTPGDIVPGSATVISSVVSNNVVYVVYSQKKDDIKYTVKYYKDSVSTANWLDQDIVGSGTLGDTIVPNREWKVPAGYQFPGDIAPGSATVITAVEDDNIVYVVYKKKTDIKYTVKYYKDSVSTANWLDQDIIESGTLGDTIVPDCEWKVPAGYQFPGDIDPSSATVITPVEDDNIVYVVYKRKTDIKYTVKYYKDSVSTANWLDQDIIESGTLGDTIVPDREWKVPAGYKFPGDIDPSSATVITPVEDDNIVYVVYKKDSVAYKVNYYRDTFDSAGYIDSYDGSGTLSSPITPDLTMFRPKGYVGTVLSGSATVIDIDPAKNIVNVLYEKETETNYTIEYYYMEDDVKFYIDEINDDSTKTYIGDEVTLTLDQLNARKDQLDDPDKYDNGVQYGDVPVEIIEENQVIQVIYYPAGEYAKVTVNIYVEQTPGEKDFKLDTTKYYNVLIGSTLSSSNYLVSVPGAKFSEEDSYPAQIVVQENPALNVINLYYVLIEAR